MKQGYVIVFSPDQDQPIDNFWDGSRQRPVNSQIPFDNAHFFENRAEARAAAGQLQINFPNQEVAIVPATFEVLTQIPNTPEVLTPAPPASGTTTAGGGGGTTTGGTTTGG